jgi:Fuc2NAc and GlcNAc transferase
MAFLVGLLGTASIRRYAISADLIDYQNARSSHVNPTPRGGGLAFVVGGLSGVVALAAAGRISHKLALALVLCGGMVSLIGYLDDYGKATVPLRFAVHVVAAFTALLLLGGLPDVLIGSILFEWGWLGYLVGVVVIVWALNLFNFMDGIDGIAASEAIFVLTAAAFLQFIGGTVDTAWPAAVLASSILGFLRWNWPVAKIFMGDVGSGFLGYIIALLAVASTRENPVAIFEWLILGGVFFVDATVTLIRRLIRGDRVYEAHRSHAYQWLARRWKSHLRVTMLVWIVNVFWLFPFAWLCTRYPTKALFFVLAALGPLVPAALRCGSGRAESKMAID